LVQTGRSGEKRRPAERGPQARVLRIIGGRWRGRKLRFPPSEAIRPTPDRVRETLFNWLATRLPGARCLDLFAGSGALGLEALSRGASHVTFVERDAQAVRELRARLTEWQASGAVVWQMDALDWLRREAERFDIAFLDPPFASDLLAKVTELLHAGQWLNPGALIYVEYPARAAAPPVPQAWRLAKAKRAGEVGYYLLSA
jgi:16S rRNA (guanine966-N2)-methyltransferase